MSVTYNHVCCELLAGDYVYWTDVNFRSVERMHKESGLDRRFILEARADLIKLIGVDLDEPRNATNACAVDNGGCSHLCLNRPEHLGGAVCACAMSYELQSDGRSCLVPEGFLLYTERSSIFTGSLNASNNIQVLPISGVHDAQAIDFDVADKRVYWADAELQVRKYNHQSDRYDNK